MITVKEISTKKELKKFVKFPFKLYKNNKYWVPPIIKDEVESFDKTKNPVFQHADARFFLAFKNDKIVGRIVAIINWVEIKEQKIKKMRFGWFDFIDDIEVSTILLDKVIEIGKENELEFVEGPVGFSNLDKVGVLTYGFDHIGTMITWYNHAYYPEHFKQLGFQKSQKFIENHFFIKDVKIEKFHRYAKILKERFKLRALNFKSTDEILRYADEMFALFNLSYSKLSSFVPMSDAQIDYFKKKYLPFINPEFIKFVVDENDRLVSFSITMPSFSRALQKSKGKLFPFGIAHFIQAKKNINEAIFYLIGVAPEYQKKGVTAIIFDEYFKTYEKIGVKKCILTPELVDNKDIHLIWRNFNPITHKKRCTYKLEI